MQKNNKTILKDPDFEEQKVGVLNDNWNTRPPQSSDHFQVIKDPNSSSGDYCLKVEALKDQWFGFAQLIELEVGKKYTVKINVKGDPCEMHLGSCVGNDFIGWNNGSIPGKDWQEVQFDIYPKIETKETQLYFNIISHGKDAIVYFDDICITLEVIPQSVSKK